MIKVDLLSQAKNKQTFVNRFDQVQRSLYLSKDRNLFQEGQLAHLLSLFENVDKELFIVQEAGIDIGRICVNVSAANLSDVVFGMLEYPRDRADVLKQLLKYAEKWALDKGRNKIIGPIDLNVWFSNRFRDHDFETPFLWEPSNPECYLRNTLYLGYKIDKEYHSKLFADSRLAFERTKIGHDLALKHNHSFEMLDLHSEEKLQKLYRLNIASFEHNYMYEPISYDQYKNTHIAAFKNMSMDYSFFIKNESGDYLGYLFAFLDGEYLVIKSLLIDPSSQGMQLSSALVHKAIKTARDKGVIKAIGAMVRKGNVSDYFFDNIGTAEKVHEYKLVSKII